MCPGYEPHQLLMLTQKDSTHRDLPSTDTSVRFENQTDPAPQGICRVFSVLSS